MTIRADLDHERDRRRRTRLAAAATAGAGMGLVVLLLAVWVWRLALADLPATPDAAGMWRMGQTSIRFIDRNGEDIGRRGPVGGEVLRLGDLPAHVPRAFLAAEDRRFYRHPGVDPVGIARAAWANLRSGRVAQGGSTITQQLARTLFLTPEQTLRRKIQEAALALAIERRIGKDEILKLYLNRIYFGAGAYGLEAAAQTYFGKSARALSLEEAALLAALPKAPSRLDPTNDFDAALDRSKLVLTRMRQESWITAAEEAEARATPPVLAAEPAPDEAFGYVLDFAAAQVRQLAPPEARDLVVQLSIDAELQREAAAAVRAAVAGAADRGARQGALVALGPGGAFRALVGGVDHRASPFDRALQARRQPGSAFKPFVYATALEAGMSPGDLRRDEPVRFGDWAPQNAGGGHAGEMTLAEALARSVNTIAAALTAELGPERVAGLARRFGMGDIPPRPALPVALGAYEVRLVDLVAAYQVFQQGGLMSPPYVVERIEGTDGRELYSRRTSAPVQVYDRARSGQMVRMLEHVIEGGAGRRAALDRPAAGKTGTTQNNRDAWFVGFTPDLVAGVWFGDDRAQPMQGVAGADLPALTWRRFMLAAHRGLPATDFDAPAAALERQDDPRAAFYGELAADFAVAAEAP